METNPYAPPQAEVADVEPATLPITPFFPCSKTKLIVMSTLTLTLYQLVWFFMNWRHIQRKGANVLPFVRSLFAVIFCYALFDRVRWYRKDLPSSSLQAGLLALGFIVVTIVSAIYDRVSERVADPLGPLLISLIASYASVLFLLPVQTAIDTINREEVPDHDRNDRFTVWNWLWMAIGVALTVAAFSGL